MHVFTKESKVCVYLDIFAHKFSASVAVACYNRSYVHVVIFHENSLY